MATLKQKTAFGPGIYRGHKLDLAKLREYIDGTNKAIAAGISIPLLKKHAPINAGDKATEQFATGDGQGSGWITKVDIEDGAIAWEAKDVPDADAKAVQEGTLKFTSPEFRPHYVCEKAGVYEGPVIRHFAFTPLPGNPHQGAIETIALGECSDDCWQFDESEKQPLALGEDLDNVTPAATLVQDSSYKDSFTTEDHVDPPGNPSEENESIDWDTIDEPAKNKILDRIHEELSAAALSEGEEARFNYEHNGHGDDETWKKAMNVVGDRYGGSTNTRNWATIVQVFKKMGGTTQHAEDDDRSQNHRGLMGSLLRKHGYSEGVRYASPDHEGLNHTYHMGGKGAHDPAHLVTLHQGGEWLHTANKKTTMGFGHRFLSKHLAKIHGTSQHAEDNPMAQEADKKKKPVDSASVDDASVKKAGEDLAVEDVADNKQQQQQMPPQEAPQPDVNTNPDMPKKATDKSKLAAVLAGLNQKGVVLPSDFTFENDAALDIMLAALNSSIKAESEAEAESEPDEDDQNNNVTDAPMPFSEQELAALPPKVREQLEILQRDKEAAETKALQYEEARETERNEYARITAAHTIAAARIPPALKNILLNAHSSTIQFSEGKEHPTYTAVEVAEMVEAIIPKSMQFEIEDVEEVEAPKANQADGGKDNKGNPTMTVPTTEQFFETNPVQYATMHVDAERAEAIVAKSPIVRNSAPPPGGQPIFNPVIPTRT